MKESIGSTFLYNIIFVFIIIVMGLLVATMNYYKAFKVNTRILSTINKRAGYNRESKEEIENYLLSIGYNTGSTNPVQNDNECRRNTRNGGQFVSSSALGAGPSGYLYCVYYYADDSSKKEKEKGERYYSYGVTTYILVDLPIVGEFKVPVYSKGTRIYKFNTQGKANNCQKGVEKC